MLKGKGHENRQMAAKNRINETIISFNGAMLEGKVQEKREMAADIP